MRLIQYFYFYLFLVLILSLKTDNKRLNETCMRSEFENEMLALELVNDRIKLKGNLHTVCLFLLKKQNISMKICFILGRRSN